MLTKDPFSTEVNIGTTILAQTSSVRCFRMQSHVQYNLRSRSERCSRQDLGIQPVRISVTIIGVN